MTDFNSERNRAVWFDIPVADLDRAASFYSAVLSVKVDKEEYEGIKFGVLEHDDGNGGCLVVNGEKTSSDHGVLLYMNVHDRIHDAISNVESKGGKVIKPIHAIGPYGFRAIVLDSEGNRIALHSESDK